MTQEIGFRIKELRIKNNLKQTDLASHLYVSPQAVCKWELGKNAPDLNMLVKLSDLFNTSIDYILKGNNEKITYCYTT